MASRTNKVEVEITATDEATPKIEKLERKIDGLEADEARITVVANTERLQTQLDAAKQKLDGLDGDEATVQLRAVGTLEEDVEQARALLARLDGQTGTVRINAVDTATADIRQVSRELNKLDGDTARVRTNVSGSLGRTAGGVAAGIGITQVATALFDSVQEANNLAIEVQQVADATGAPLDQAGRLLTVFRQNGFEVNDLLDILGQVNQTLAQNPDLAAQLGVNMADNQSIIDTFLQSVDGVGTKFEDVNERQVAASQLFGEEGVRQIQRVTTAGGDLEDQMASIPTAQLTDEGDTERFREANDNLIEFKAHLTEIQLMLAEDILPLVSAVASGIEAWFTGVGNFGEWWGNQGERFGNWVKQELGGSTGLTEKGIIARNTGGFTGGAAVPFGPETSPLLRQAVVTIINPPGTPTTTVDAARIYERRNGFGF